MESLFLIGIISLAMLYHVIKIVPQQEAWIVETLGKFDRLLEPGLNLLIPFIQRVAYKHTLKEQPIDVHAQTAISNDNVTLLIDGVLYVKIVDAKAASYGVSNPYYAITQLAQTTMRSEIGKLPLDKTFEERESLNAAIVTAINHAAINWGIQCMRYEIKDIQPPESVLTAMELQVAAERQKRARILESEGLQQAEINNASAEKTSVVLASEGSYIDQVNRAKGEAEAIALIAEANAKSIDVVAKAIKQAGGSDAVSLKIAESYIDAFSKIAKETNTVVIPSHLGEPSSAIAQVMTIFDHLKSHKKKDA